ncbi:proline-rich transmembrane protein 2-like [Bolinopsis microptera]|uniref:proline-rich transmembrane protein 2-like n=1 Tax=Bolinopsis microptera TaxID=2820187 RepID=UPI00307A60A3
MADYSKDQPPSHNAQGAYPPQQQQHPPQQGYPPQQVYPPAQGQPGQGYVIQQHPQPQVVVVQQGNQGIPPQTNCTIAWISCLCFFWPVGLVAVVKAHEAEQCVGRGDFEGARRSGEAAKKWAIAAIITQVVLGVVLGVVVVIIYAISIAAVDSAIDSAVYGYDGK